MARRKKSQKLCNSLLRPSLAEVLDGIKSLYVDEVKPSGRILRRRIYERAVAAAAFDTQDEPLPDVDAAHVRACCDTCRLLAVEDVDGGEWAVVFVTQPDNFVDLHAPDSYSEEFWSAFAAFLNENPDLALSGGRFAGAQALAARGLSCFAGFSLGQVCHIVELAISERKVLGYQSGYIRPYMRSFSMAKAESAQSQQPCAFLGHGASAMPIATFEIARSCIRVLLAEATTLGERPGVVSLSNVKRLFRSRFSIELSETMLGYTKLSELLQDKRFSDVCEVLLEWNGYCVVQPRQLQGSCDGGRGFGDGPMTSHNLSPLSSSTPLMPGMLSAPLGMHNSYAHKLACDRYCDGNVALDAACLSFEACYSAESTSVASGEDIASTPGSSWGPDTADSTLVVAGESSHFFWPTGESCGSCLIKNTFIHTGPSASSPDGQGCRKRSQSVPKDMRLNQESYGFRIKPPASGTTTAPSSPYNSPRSWTQGAGLAEGTSNAPPPPLWNDVPNRAPAQAVESPVKHAGVPSFLGTVPMLATAGNSPSGPMPFSFATTFPSMGRQDATMRDMPKRVQRLPPAHTLSPFSLSTTPTPTRQFSLNHSSAMCLC